VLFLPGAGGDREFWRPVAERLPDSWEVRLLNWPGAGAQAHDPGIADAEDLVVRLAEPLDGPADVVAQSMGGVIAVCLALAHPGLVRRLVLVATSGGVDVRALGGSDWRPEYLREFPHAARWVVEEQRDLTDQIGRLAAPTSLIWGDQDPISPLRVGELLAGLLPNAALSIIAGGTHSLAYDHPDAVASLIEAHLA
jgi:pimeloyl-ACP methyl ester carboxylesterase